MADVHTSDLESLSASVGHGHSHGPTPEFKVQSLDIYRAAQLGDLARCQEIIEKSGIEILLEQDERGHTAMHWACLAGHNNVIRYFIQCNAPLDKPSSNELAPKPMHWACVNGHILTVDLLLQHGVSINTTDNRGCTPLIIATQYGQTMLVGYLIGKGARKDFTDIDGDTALHWAAFKGHAEIAQLLVYSGFNAKQKDDVGQAPLHLACLSGSLETVRFITMQEPDLFLKDNNGKSALDLAKGRNYKDIISYLEKTIKMETYCSFCKKAFNMLGGEKRHLVFYMICLIFFSYPMYFYQFSYLWSNFQSTNVIFLLLNIPMWYFFLKTARTDPGYLERHTEGYDLALKQVSLHKEWETDSENNPLTRLCHTCRLVRPQRAKHCRVCGRCVNYMDHHCNFAYNCIGAKNRVYFILYLASSVIASYFAFFLAKQVLNEFGWTPLRVVFALLYIVFVPMMSFLLVTQLLMISINLTTNERINMKRYTYLRDDQGVFRNPYDRGFFKNWMEFFNFLPALRYGIDRKEGELFSV
ncbi:uncharacterized protein LOC130655081 [Hydractinia symbiolongicarpus]|uniref:uncharacterized protein LOC130655081 n=1 Tax=Hydractinia symbiolongicarpus TaxID=13093 RepID=UPI00254F3D2B|nr:uncharacterized protein LOC130655081 [Hydractinia symbiolongicarpus]